MSAMGVVWTTAMLALGGGVPTSGVPAPSARDVAVRDGAVIGMQVLPSLNGVTSMTELLVSLSGTVETRDFTMQGPDRIVLDLVNARLALGGAEIDAVVDRGGVRRLHTSQYAADIVRVVLEVDGLLPYTVSVGNGYVRVSLENPWEDSDFAPWEATALAGMSVPVAVAVGAPTRAGIAANVPRGSGPQASGPQAPFRPGLNISQQAQRIDIDFDETPLAEVLRVLGDLTNRTILIGSGAATPVNAHIVDQPWDIALQGLLDTYGFAAEEQASGIIRVAQLESFANRDSLEPLVIQSFRINYANATELEAVVTSLLTERGRVSVNPGTNTLVVTDIARVASAVDELLEGLDTRPASISISAKIVFVNKTDMQELGVIYDLKDSRGNQLNQISPGGIDRDGDGVISLVEEDDEIVPIGTNVISLGGSSVAALGNANQRVVGPSLTFLTSLILGRHTLNTFLEALQSVELSDIQAAPQATTLDNQQAELIVGEQTPIRVIDAGAAGGAAGGQAAPQATVQLKDTGIILRVTPHVTAGDLIWMQLSAERSGIAVAQADVGVTFDQQKANTRVLVADGQTAVIAGMTVTERTELRSGIPLLQDLPLVGRFFRLSRVRTDQKDLIFLVTPQIIRD